VFRMHMWQAVVVGLVTAVCVGWMSFTVARMFARRAEAPASLREATAFESARVGADAPAGAKAFDGFSYRVPGRLAGRVRLMVNEGRMSLAGPRVPSGLYQAWIWIQALLLALVPAALAAAVVKLDWRWAVAALAIFVVGQAFSAAGAGIWPGLGEMDYIEAGRFKAIDFPLSQVRDVKIGVGWADGGIDAVLMPVKGGIDAMSTGRAVSFFAPDDEGREVRYAIHMPSDADADELASLLR